MMVAALLWSLIEALVGRLPVADVDQYVSAAVRVEPEVEQLSHDHQVAAVVAAHVCHDVDVP